MLEGRAIGRLVAEPTIRKVQKNDTDYKVCEFRLACQQRKNKVDFIDAAAWRGMGDFIFQHVHKGQKIYIEGTLHVPPYDKEKDHKFDPYIVVYNFEFCDRKLKEVPSAPVNTEQAAAADEDFTNTMDDNDFMERRNLNA